MAHRRRWLGALWDLLRGDRARDRDRPRVSSARRGSTAAPQSARVSSTRRGSTAAPQRLKFTAAESPEEAQEAGPARTEATDVDPRVLACPDRAVEPAVIAPSDPLNVELLITLVREHFDSEEVDLPAFPSLAHRVIELVSKPDVQIGRLVTLISQDPAITGKVLKVANSAFYSRGVEIFTVRDAVTRLGLREVARMTAAIATTVLFDPKSLVEFELFPAKWEQIHDHSLTCAFAASWLSFEQRIGSPDQAFMGGMFHDLGKIVALRSLCSLLISGRLSSPGADGDVDAMLEATHVEIGGKLNEKWSLPRPLSSICEDHHQPEIPVGADHANLHLVRVVSGLNALRAGMPCSAAMEDELGQSLQALRLDRFQVRALATQIREFAQKVEELFGGARGAPGA